MSTSKVATTTTNGTSTTNPSSSKPTINPPSNNDLLTKIKADAPPIAADNNPVSNHDDAPPTKEDLALLAALDRDDRNYDKEQEIRRILNAFAANAYSVLDLLPGVPEKDIKMCYRKKSLLIHPDKTDHPLAQDAFDRLRKAVDVLSDEKQRTELDEIIADARMLIMREYKWTVDAPQLQEDEFIYEMWPEKTKELLLEEGRRKLMRTKAALREQGREQRKEEEAAEQRKRKHEHDKAWDGKMDERVSSWRDFQKGPVNKKKKKDKVPTLG